MPVREPRQRAAPHRRHRCLLAFLLLTLLAGCSLPRWFARQEPCRLDPAISKADLIAHLNRNVTGTGGHPGLTAWQTGDATLRVSGAGMPTVPRLPATLAVQAPRNLRLIVSHPLSGGQEVDLGSNDERFWFWTKEAPQIITCRQEDVPDALRQLSMPIHIHPDWLMEVFGVIPIDGSEFNMVRPHAEATEVQLIANRVSPLGETVQRVIRVDLCRGEIIEHQLRTADGRVIARALMDKHTELSNGATLPMLVKLDWPEAQVQMTLNLGRPVPNPPALAENGTLWQIPSIPGARPVDIGALARRDPNGRAEPPSSPVSHPGLQGHLPAGIPITPAGHRDAVHDPAAGRVKLPSQPEPSQPEPSQPASSHAAAFELEAPEPARTRDAKGFSPTRSDEDQNDGSPAWARPFSADD
jgi:hypothetical protein